MSEIIKVIILGIVEGLTEFLPISSTGHLIVAAALLDFQNALGGMFEIFIQLGAVVAVVIFFRAELLKQLTSVSTDQAVRRFWLNLVIAFVPAALLGFLFNEQITAVLFRPVVVALSLIIGGIIFLLVERRPAPVVQAASLESMTPRQALLVGVSQIVALIPGVSRSGATILGGILCGVERTAATQFSFYLAIPTLGIASIYSLVKHLDAIQTGDLMNLFIGALVSGIVAWIAIRWLLNYVARNNFIAFGYYRILAGLVIIALILLRVLPL